MMLQNNQRYSEIMLDHFSVSKQYLFETFRLWVSYQLGNQAKVINDDK